MKSIGVIGRNEWLYNSMLLLEKKGFNIAFIITSKEAPEYKKTSSDFKTFAEERGIPFLLESKITSKDVKKLKLSETPNICISVNYTGILSEDVIGLFKHGILNAHGGDLPRYKGNACQAWAIINGEEKIGICVHKMVPDQIDSGDIIQREYIPIKINTKIGDIYKLFEKLIPKMFLDSLNNLIKEPNFILEKINDSKQNSMRCYPRNSTDNKINWDKTNVEIIRLINASNFPYAGAFCFLDELKLIIWDAEIFDDNENYLAVPGQVSSFEKDGSIIVIAGKGKVKINLIQVEKIKMKPTEIIRSIRKRLT